MRQVQDSDHLQIISKHGRDRFRTVRLVDEIDVEIALLGRFEVTVAGEPIAASSWSRRHAAALVKLLAVSPGRQLHRERVIDALWPDDLLDRAVPKLHKAAHFARHVIGRDNAIVLRDNTVALFPDADIIVDAVVFEQHARSALGRHDRDAARHATTRYGGELLPADPYDDWAVGHRERLAHLHRELLRLAGRWEALVALDPGDEEAHLELMREHIANGRRHAALRQFDRMDRSLREEIGVGPSADAVRLRDELLADSTAPDLAPRTQRRPRCSRQRRPTRGTRVR